MSFYILDTDHLSLLERNHTQLATQLQQPSLEAFVLTIITAEEKLRLRIGTQDLRIAAITLAVGGIWLTRNSCDFGQITNLPIQDWTI